MLSQVMLLNKILTTKDLSIIAKNNLNADYFFDCTAEFLFITNHAKTYGSVPDKMTFAEHFPDFDLFDVAEPDTYLIEQLFKDYNMATMAAGFNGAKKYIESGEVERAQDILSSTNAKQRTCAVLTSTDLMQDTSRYDRYLERASNKNAYISTGLPELDALTGGTDRENENGVIFARTGQGKTQVLMYMTASAVHQNLRVGIYEGEMSADKTGYRFDTFYGHMKNRCMNRGDLYIQQEYKRYIESIVVEDKHLFLLTPNDVPGGAVTVDHLRTFIEQNNLDILFVDQYDLLEDTSEAKVKHERVGNIARDIKLLQVEKKIPIWSVCQMNRTKLDDGNGGSIVDSTQVAGSDMIARYATVLLAIEQKYDPATEKVELDINVVKARDGGDHNKLKYTADFDSGYLVYIPTEKDGISTPEDLQNIADSYEPEEDEQVGY